MTNYMELIAEADKEAKRQDKLYATAVVMALAKEAGEYAECRNTLRRLAAAVRELAPPEGWRISEYKRKQCERVAQSLDDPDFWVAVTEDGKLYHRENKHPTQWEYFNTASAAMTALDGKKK